MIEIMSNIVCNEITINNAVVGRNDCKVCSIHVSEKRNVNAFQVPNMFLHLQ